MCESYSTLLVIFSINQVFAVIFFIALLVWLSFLSERKIKKKVLFFGDSITQQATEPGGYISILESMLQNEQVKRLALLASGVGGNTVNDLYDRIDTDVINLKPDVVIIFAGVNDAWRKKIGGSVTNEEVFKKTYRQMVSALQKNGIAIVLCTPAVIGEKNNGLNELDDVLETYCNIIRNIAAEQGLVLIDMRKVFMEYEAEHNQLNHDRGILTKDGVHLSITGNELVANKIYSMLKEI